VRRIAQKDAADRKQNIIKYTLDVVNAVLGVFQEVEADGDPSSKDVTQKYKPVKSPNKC